MCRVECAVTCIHLAINGRSLRKAESGSCSCSNWVVSLEFGVCSDQCAVSSVLCVLVNSLQCALVSSLQCAVQFHLHDHAARDVVAVNQPQVLSHVVLRAAWAGGHKEKLLED